MRIAITTGGGDAPGLNAVIRAIVLSAHQRGWQCYGIRRGYDGLLAQEGVMNLGPREVRGITHLGGTILGTTNRGNPCEMRIKWRGKRRLAAEIVVEELQRLKIGRASCRERVYVLV